MAQKSRISPFLLLRLLGIAIFIYILVKIDISEIAQALSNLDIGYFILGIIFQLGVLVIKAVRWHIMNDGSRNLQNWLLSTGRFFESYAIGIVTPGRLGELLKAGHENTKQDKAGALLRVVSERGFDVGIFILVASLALLSFEIIKIKTWIIFLFILASLVLLYFSFLLLSSKSTIRLLQNLLRKISKKTREMDIGGKQYKSSTVFLIFLLSILSNLSFFVSCYYLAQSVFLDYPFVSISGGVAIAGIVNMLPITIMGLGTREIIFLTLFTPFSESIILAFSATMLFVAQIGGGLVSMVLGQIILAKNHNQNSSK
jgi:hypothetical protein